MNLTRYWAKVALFNFVILSFVGLLLRYKILYPLPFIDHKHLLHGHSHFAFSGWVSTALYIAYIHLLNPEANTKKRLGYYLWIHFLSSWGMLLTFPFMGYAAASICFSTLSILISFVISYEFKILISRSSNLTFEKKWLYSALICNVLSALGTFVLAYMMVTKNSHPFSYFGAVYFFLHFQYNGWFLLSIIGLLLAYVSNSGLSSISQSSNNFFYVIAWTLLPTWVLTLLWMDLHGSVETIALVAAVVQLIGLLFFLKTLKLIFRTLKNTVNRSVWGLWTLSVSAFILKIILQTLSAIPQLNQYAFGIRPIVIGFLHLVLLGFVSLFLLGYLFENKLLQLKDATSKWSLWLFCTGVLLNELILMIQGLCAINSSDLPFSNHILLTVAVMMFLGLAILFGTQIRFHFKEKNA